MSLSFPDRTAVRPAGLLACRPGRPADDDAPGDQGFSTTDLPMSALAHAVGQGATLAEFQPQDDVRVWAPRPGRASFLLVLVSAAGAGAVTRAAWTWRRGGETVRYRVTVRALRAAKAAGVAQW